MPKWKFMHFSLRTLIGFEWLLIGTGNHGFAVPVCLPLAGASLFCEWCILWWRLVNKVIFSSRDAGICANNRCPDKLSSMVVVISVRSVLDSGWLNSWRSAGRPLIEEDILSNIISGPISTLYARSFSWLKVAELDFHLGRYISSLRVGPC